MKRLAAVSFVLGAACVEQPPSCDESSLECQFAHYRHDSSRKPPVQWRAGEIAKFEGAREYVEAHRSELHNFAYEELVEELNAAEQGRPQ